MERPQKRNDQKSKEEIDELERRFLDLQEVLLSSKKAYEERLEKHKDMAILGRGFVYIESKIVREAVIDMGVHHVLKWTSVLYAVTRVLQEDDDLWHTWWLRDFHDFAREIGFDLPLWITSDVVGNNGVLIDKTITDQRFRTVPWRRYYYWCLFFRRSLLSDFADMMFGKTGKWIKTNGFWASRPENWPRNMKYLPSGGLYALDYKPLPYHKYSGIRHDQLLYRGDKILQPSDLFNNSGRVEEDEYAEECNDNIYQNGPSIHELYHSAITHHRDLLAHIEPPRTKLNFDYIKTMEILDAWYTRAKARLPDDPSQLTSLYSLPPAPMRVERTTLEGTTLERTILTFFAGDEIEDPSCLRCNKQTPIMYECMRCNVATYCSEVCSQLNWPNHKQDCKQ